MSPSQEENQHRFLQRCEEAFHLVTGFLNDSLPWGFVPERRSGYVHHPEKRQVTKDKVLKTMEVLATAIDRHGLEEIAISYNGGKDCLVMLIILLATIHKKFSSEVTSNSSKSLLPSDYKLDSIYINSEIPFAELSSFIQSSTQHYNLNPIMIKDSLKNGFEHYLNDINPKIKTVIVGVRHSDPYGGQLSYEQVTDHHWPKFLRIHPILHWNYVDIWDFLIGCNLDYCPIYDEGYTSLGGVNNTVPNPYLKNDDGSYKPAYMLDIEADERERMGRSK